MTTKIFSATIDSKVSRFVIVALLSTMCLAATGCASFDLSKRIPWGTNDDGVETPPGRLSAVWTDTIMTQPGKPAMRGFGGRIMFFDQGDEPIKTEGMMEIYAWDETDRDPANPTPDRKFVFHAQDFQKHYSKGRLGHSYSFWIPWDEVGGKQTQISLMVKFSPTHGAQIIGEQSKHLLPGVVPTPATSPLRDQLREQITAQQMLTQQRAPQPVPQQFNSQQMSGQHFNPQQNGNPQPALIPQIQNQNFQQMNGQSPAQLPLPGQQLMYDNQVMTMSYDQSSTQQNIMPSVMQNSNGSANSGQFAMPQNQTMNSQMTSGVLPSNALGSHGSMETFEIPLKAGSPLARKNPAMPQMLPQLNQSTQMLNNQIPTQYPTHQLQPSHVNGQMMNSTFIPPGNHATNLQNRGGPYSMEMRQKANAARHERIVNGLKNTQANNPNGVTMQSNEFGTQLGNPLMAANVNVQSNYNGMQNASAQTSLMQNPGSVPQSGIPMQNGQIPFSQNSLSNGSIAGTGYSTTVSYGPTKR